MTVLDFFKNLFGKKDRFFLDESKAVADFAGRAGQETAVRELALNVAAGMIANTVSKCEFMTFKGGAERKGDEYYLWNVRPNANESAAVFIQKWVYKLCLDGEALVVFDKPIGENAVQAFVADSFSVKKEFALFPNIYTGVYANNFSFSRDFSADESLYCRLDNEDVKRLLDMYYNSYKKLIASTMKAFTKSRGERGVLTTQRSPGDPNYEATVRDMQEKYFKPYFEADNGVLPLFDGQKYERINGNGQRELADAGDIRKLVNDVFDMTALAFHIPPAFMRGEMAESGDLMTNYLTFCIDPICDMLSKEMTAKRLSKKDYLSGNYIKIDTSSVKHADLLDAATAVDKIISSGVLSINELRKALGKPRINEEWADRHYITKNYSRIDDALDAAGEGR